MQFDSETVTGILIVVPSSMDLDASKAEEFKRDITPVIEGQSRVAIDMENIQFMDSAGLGAMLSVFKKVRAEGGQFKVFGVKGEVKDLFDLVRMQRLLDVHNDKESAIQSFRD